MAVNRILFSAHNPEAIVSTVPKDDVAQRGRELYERLVLPKLHAEDDGKYVAVDLATGDYEVDADDYSANMRLLARRPGARVWLEKVGEPTACKIRCVDGDSR